MCKILGRIEEISQKENISIGAIEKTIGASKGVLYKAIQKGTDIQSKWLEKIVENFPTYSAEWLLTGNGEMLKNTTSPIPIQQKKEEQPQLNKQIVADKQEIIDTQKKLIAALEHRILELERSTAPKPSGFRAAQSADTSNSNRGADKIK